MVAQAQETFLEWFRYDSLDCTVYDGLTHKKCITFNMEICIRVTYRDSISVTGHVLSPGGKEFRKCLCVLPFRVLFLNMILYVWHHIARFLFIDVTNLIYFIRQCFAYFTYVLNTGNDSNGLSMLIAV